jgi:DNA mismatch repair protein MLH1
MQAGQTQADVSTPGSSTIPQAISLLYGGAVSKELMRVIVSPSNAGSTGKGKGKQADEAWSAEAYASSVNFQSKRFTFLLFINRESSGDKPAGRFSSAADRLVDSQRIKRAIESVYSAILPKGASPFVYLRCARCTLPFLIVAD